MAQSWDGGVTNEASSVIAARTTAKWVARSGSGAAASMIVKARAMPPLDRGAIVGQDRPRLAVIDALALTTPLDPYLTLSSLRGYAGCSVRWLRDRLRDPHHPLPCFRLPGGKVLVRRSDFDAWMARYRRVGAPGVHDVVRAVVAELAHPPR